MGMVDEGGDFVLGGSQRPGVAEEVQRVVVVNAALEMKGQMEVEQGSRGNGD
jgi:hypothetical protein